ncbi:hypothetical protein [Kitasatospora aureofaciens]|uniref:hypothetical protein n=1 Tax=Kitasatospora aureofaciens TaxID=1894 RepID=UPI0033EF3474
MALDLLAIQRLAENVLGCVCAALDVTAAEVAGQPGCPDCRSCVVPGAPAWDGCEDPCSGTTTGGQLSVNVAQLYTSTLDHFPDPVRAVQGVRSCTPSQLMVAELHVTLLRCAPTISERGCPPTCEELAAAGRILHIDMSTVHNALMCCLPTTAAGRGSGPRFSLGAMRTIGPDGGCVGLEQRLTVALDYCACPGGGA